MSKTTVELGLRDKLLDKIFLFSTLPLAVFCLLFLFFGKNYGTGTLVLLIFALAVNLLASGFSLCHLCAPKVAIEGDDVGIYVHGLFRSRFYSFAEIEHASYRERNRDYSRSSGIFAYLHRERLDIGRIQIVVRPNGQSRTITLVGIVNASFAAHWINEEKEKSITPLEN